MKCNKKMGFIMKEDKAKKRFRDEWESAPVHKKTGNGKRLARLGAAAALGTLVYLMSKEKK